MRQGGKVLCFWISVFALVIGLQSTCSAAHSDRFEHPNSLVEGDRSQVVLAVAEVVVSNPAADEPASQPEPANKPEPASKPLRDRDHNPRNLWEMGLLFLEGGALLAAMILLYKGLKRWKNRGKSDDDNKAASK
jgi:hypothetical protein